ncbi:molybdopterin molybdotransferase MoeA [Streptomyces sp. KLOTTS4A1]|uniref:molybdopterin molybdotransferase MoeA n=1 Tax=Streptomyces sp. KLOTTS4A1 TaxID=3390996 RepID=UPI0039F4781B
MTTARTTAPDAGPSSSVHDARPPLPLDAARTAHTWEQARAIARDAAPPLPAVTRDLGGAYAHALAEPLAALTDLPPFDTSAMDGWAVAGPGPWRLQDTAVLAGGQPEPLRAGTAVPIATGAQLPQNATAVLRREHGTVDQQAGVLHDQPMGSGHLTSGRDIRPRGQECRSGEGLVPACTAVTPSVLGMAAACGYDRLLVHRRPRVELLVLGDELLESGPPREGKVRDALGPLLPPWLHSLGAEIIRHRIVADDLALLREAVLSSPADVVVTTGSTAAGPVDFLHDTLAEAGAALLVDSVAVRPGHPMLLARLSPAADGRPRHLVGLPGNPLAAVAGTVTLAAPLLRRLGGHADAEQRRATITHALPGHPHDTRLVPVLRMDDGAATQLPFDGPAMLRGLVCADGLAVVPPGGVPANATVEVLDVPGP